MSWENILKEITEDTDIEEMDETTSFLEEMGKVFEIIGKEDDGYNIFTEGGSIDSRKKIQDLLDLYYYRYGGRMISEYKGSGETGYHIDSVLGDGENRFGFEMYFGHFGNHYIRIRGLPLSVKNIDEEELDFLGKLVSILG